MASAINDNRSFDNVYINDPNEKASNIFDFGQLYCSPESQLRDPMDDRSWTFSPLPSPESPCFDIPPASAHQSMTWDPSEQAFNCLLTPETMEYEFASSEPLNAPPYQSRFNNTTQHAEIEQWSIVPADTECDQLSPPSADIAVIYPQKLEPQLPSPLRPQSVSKKTSSRRRPSSQSIGLSKRLNTEKNANASETDDNTSRKRLRSTSTAHATSRRPSIASTSTRSPRLPPKHPRLNHNSIEKQYRNRLNNQFEALLMVLPREGGEGSVEKKISKAEVLVLAMDHIRDLERNWTRLEKENERLDKLMGGYEKRWVQSGGVILP